MGDGGTILRLQNGTWQAFTGPTGNDLFDVAIVSAAEAWAVGEHGVILRYTDAPEPPTAPSTPTRTATSTTPSIPTPTRTRTPTPPSARPLQRLSAAHPALGAVPTDLPGFGNLAGLARRLAGDVSFHGGSQTEHAR